jgi:hypothetical protein
VFVDRPPLLREAIIVGCGVASYFATPKELHQKNDFSFAPLREVAWLFLGIFFTTVPVLDFMRLHAAKFPINSPAQFYWLSGGLSSVLDNAPTYLTFLANAMGPAQSHPRKRDRRAKFLKLRRPGARRDFHGRGVFRRHDLHRQQPEFYGQGDYRARRRARAEFFRIHFQIRPACSPPGSLSCWLV